MHANYLGILINANSDAAGLEWDLRVFISSKFSGYADMLGYSWSIGTKSINEEFKDVNNCSPFKVVKETVFQNYNHCSKEIVFNIGF